KDLHLQCDGWSNLNNESIINFVVSKPDPLFVDFVMTKDNRYNARELNTILIDTMQDTIAELIEKILIKYGPEKFLVIIAEHAANMRAALNIVKEKYPNIVPLGFLAHLLYLLCSDILCCTSVKFFMATVIDIVKIMKNSHILKAQIKKVQG
ncbi:MAG: DUF domain-containing protein, partial [Candidatus Hodgkinia cicadicola]